MGIFKAKKKLWIIIACVLVVVIAATATGLVILLNRDTEDTSAADSNKIYWNIDRQLYYGQGEGGASSRELSKDDGYYHILLAADGRPIERKAKSLTVVNKVDGEDAMGIVIDEQTRAITDIIPLDEISGGFLCNKYYVDKVNGTELKLNSSATYMGMEMTVKLKTTTPIYDVSLQAQSDAGMPVKLESIEHKDQVSIILNKDESIYAVYITKRARITPIYWNIERKYDKKQSETTREPDKDGVYHILMAVGGEQVEVKCKNKQAVSLIDSRGSRCCGLEFDEEGYVVDSVSALKCTGGKSVASWYDVMTLDGDMFTAEKHSETARDNGKQITLTLDPDCEIYNVSTNYEDHIGEKTTLKLTDRVQGFTDATGKVVVLFIVQRWKTGDFYWNAYRMWDSTKQKSTRTRSADGYFHFIMLKDGHEVDVKVKDASVAELMDKAGSRSMGLKFSGDVVTEYIPAGDMYASKASWYDVERFVDSKTIHVKKNSTTASDAGREYDVKLKDDCKIYNTTQFYTDHLGEETTLRVGDRIQAWVDYTGKAKIIYIVGRKVTNPLTPHATNHTCKECNKNVTWTAWTSGSSLPTTSGHYYLTGDVVAPQTNIAANQNVVLCLNGHNIRAAGKRIFALTTDGSKLSIHDCVGKGQVYSKYSGDLGTTQGAIIWARSGDVNLYGGTYIAPTGISHNTGCVIHANSNRNIYIENCTIKGGTTEMSGGALYIGAGSKTVLTLKNTTITAGKAGTGHGDAVIMGSNAKLYLSGKVQITGGKDNLYLASGALIYFKDKDTLAAGSKIGVDVAAANGKITNSYYEGLEQYFESNKAGHIVDHTSAFVYLDRKNALTAHKNDTHKCEECDKSVEWIPWQSSVALPTDSGHYYLTGNVVTTGTTFNTANSDVVICLNGYNIQGTSNRVIALNGKNASLTITDCTTLGKVYNSKASAYAPSSTGAANTTQGGTIWVREGTLNIYNCTVQAPSATVPGNGGAICSDGNANKITIKNATIVGGSTAKSGGAIALTSKSSLSLTDVTIKGGKAAANGNAILLGSESIMSVGGKVNIEKQVYLADKAYLTFTSALTEGSNIGVKVTTESGKISTNYKDGAENFVKPEGASSMRMSGALYVNKNIDIPKHNDGNTHTCEHCTSDVTWEPWIETDTLPKQSGHYYLCYDVTCTQQNIPANQDVVICLNGKTISGASNANRVLAVNAENASLTITDCTGKGKVCNSKASAYEPSSDGKPNTTQGGLIWVRLGTLNIFGGTYSAPKFTVPNNGGVICSDGNANNITIKNATIIGGETKKNGGAISIEKGTLTLENVAITGGKADGNGDAIYVGNGILNVSGKVSSENQIYLNDGAYITLKGNLTEGSNLPVEVKDGDGVITTNNKDGAVDFFVSQRKDTPIKVIGGVIAYDLEAADAGKHKHAVYGNSASAAAHGISSTRYIYTAVSTEKELTDAIKNAVADTPIYIYLEKDITLTEATKGANNSSFYINLQSVTDTSNNYNGWGDSADKKINLCLNGHTITSHNNSTNDSIRILQLNAKCEFTVCDCGETKGGLVCSTENTANGTGGIANIARSATLNLYGVKLINGTAKQSGAINVATGTLNAYDCEITGGSSLNTSGLIHLTNANSTANIYDSSITGATAGYGIYLSENAKPPVLSGKIIVKDNAAGNIYIPTGKLVTLKKLDEASVIGFTATEDQVFATTDKDYLEICDLHSDNDGEKITYSDGNYIIGSAEGGHKHAVYGNSASAKNHGIDSTKHLYVPVSTEKELTDAIKNAAANTPIYIYLENDITLTAATKGANSSYFFINLQSGTPTTNNYNGWGDGADKKINLCLNGHTLTSHNNNTSKSVKILQLNAKCEFNICDCGETKGGLVYALNNSANETGGIANVARNATLNLYGVKLINGTAKQGGAINVTTGTLNAYDCEITGGSTENTSGLIHLTNANSTANIYDCSITGATAGYGIYLSDAAKAPLLSGKITVKDNATGNIYIPAGKSVTFESLTDGSEIGITYPNAGENFATSNDDFSETCNIFSDTSNQKPVYESGNYKMITLMTMFSSTSKTAVSSKLAVLSPALNLLRKAGIK